MNTHITPEQIREWDASRQADDDYDDEPTVAKVRDDLRHVGWKLESAREPLAFLTDETDIRVQEERVRELEGQQAEIAAKLASMEAEEAQANGSDAQTSIPDAQATQAEAGDPAMAGANGEQETPLANHCEDNSELPGIREKDIRDFQDMIDATLEDGQDILTTEVLSRLCRPGGMAMLLAMIARLLNTDTTNVVDIVDMMSESVIAARKPQTPEPQEPQARSVQERETEGMRAMRAAEMADAPVGNPTFKGDEEFITLAEAARRCGTTRRATLTAKNIMKNGCNELVGRIREGRLSLSAGATLAKQPKAHQDEILATGRNDKVMAKVRELRSAKKAAEEREARERRYREHRYTASERAGEEASEEAEKRAEAEMQKYSSYKGHVAAYREFAEKVDKLATMADWFPDRANEAIKGRRVWQELKHRTPGEMRSTPSDKAIRAAARLLNGIVDVINEQLPIPATATA